MHRWHWHAPYGPHCEPWESHRFRTWGPPSREEWLRRLEEYQRDLEQEAADVADLIARAREREPSEP
jgi:hypothetical protein